MPMTDQLLGASVLSLTALVFTYYTLWVIVLPFVDEDQLYIHALFPNKELAVGLPLLAGVIGLTLIGSFVAVVMLTSKKKEKNH